MILLTGASGFLGREIKESLQKRQLDYQTIGRSADDSIKCDLRLECPPISGAKIVIHAAAKAHIVPKTTEEKIDFFKVNVEGTQHILNALECNGSLQKFIFISSVAVYGLTAGVNISEDAPLLATDPYGKSKIEAEELITNWCILKNIKYYVLRLPLIAGRNAPGNLGAMVKGIKSGKYLSIGKASAKKSMVLAKDLAQFITGIQGPSGTYNLTDGYHPSISELESVIAAFYRKNKPVAAPLIVAKMVGLAGDIIGSKFPVNSGKITKITSTLSFDDTRARTLLKWKPGQVLKEWEIE